MNELKGIGGILHSHLALEPSDDACRQHHPKESYVIHTPEPDDDDYEDSVLSDVVTELLEENPLICTWR